MNLYIAFGKIAIFTMLILPIHEHGRSSHLLRSLISFFRNLKLPFFMKASLMNQEIGHRVKLDQGILLEDTCQRKNNHDFGLMARE